MKKFISLFIITILAVFIQSCRQDDENDIYMQEKSLEKAAIQNKTSEKDSIANAKFDIDESEEDPPVRNGTHWRIIK
ncbi:hypothetical protein [Chryseobacterium sp.]|uniref:hypothetical protein n=1 Tax=Chryseobacterium sp. TaxID=1871047 RepID=UPI0028985EC6|nr:hypothetical protein [Chryseobacterium sp.]